MDPLTDVPFCLALCLLKPQTKENLSFLRLFLGRYSFGLKDWKSNYQGFLLGLAGVHSTGQEALHGFLK